MKGKRKTMTNRNISGQVFSPEQARYRIVERLPDLSPEALKELLVFIDFLHFREQATDQPDKKIGKNVDYEISGAGMLSDLTSEEMPHEKIEFAKSIKGKYKNCNTNSKIFAAMKRQEIELEERKFKEE